MSLSIIQTVSGPLPVFPVAALDANGNAITAYLTANAITDAAGNEVFGNIDTPVAGSVLALLAHAVTLLQAIATNGGSSGGATTAPPGSLVFDDTNPGNAVAGAL